MDLPGFSGDSISKWCSANEGDAFPIEFPSTWFAWDCDQNYLIDPTAWSIQTDIRYSTQLPGCSGKGPGF